MENNKGNRKNVMDRWYSNATYYSTQQKPREKFKGKAQFTFDGVFITPFTHELTEDEMGRRGYTPIEVNLQPTGIQVFDAYLQALRVGDSRISSFCKRYRAKTSDLDGLVFLLTGMSNLEFRNCWIRRSADLLLRHTDWMMTEIARRSGAGTRTNLYFIYERDMNCSPTDRRYELRMPGDFDRFRIIE